MTPKSSSFPFEETAFTRSSEYVISSFIVGLSTGFTIPRLPPGRADKAVSGNLLGIGSKWCREEREITEKQLAVDRKSKQLNSHNGCILVFVPAVIIYLQRKSRTRLL
mmetsp:Transcript_10077/g.14793  ORF Transcript_10077/g.14793 Transcript_10077/m.14793 type:complete len:108 (-) Transcript_10077:121-444(-)